MALHTVGLEEGRNTLPELASRAHAGEASLLTRHGKPYAAIVPLDMLLKARQRARFLDLRGSGKGLWGALPAAGIAKAREEWD
jgi:prevent-host-death family protein